MEQLKYTGILILNYNNISDTIDCIKSINKFNSSKVKLLIIDNGSTIEGVKDSVDSFLTGLYGDSFTILEEKESSCINNLSSVCSLHLRKNCGYAVGNNKGLNLFYKDDEIDNILILNNDILFIKDMLPSLLDHLNIHQNSIISPLLLKKNGIDIDKDCCRKEYSLSHLFVQHLFLTTNIFGIQIYLKNRICLYNMEDDLHRRLVQVEMPSGSCMLFKKELFQSIGSFDANTFLYFEENILVKKLKKFNYKVYVDFSARCIHVGASTVKKTVNRSFSTLCWVNSGRYFLKNYTDASKFYLFMIEICYKLILLKAKVATFLRLHNLYK